MPQRLIAVIVLIVSLLLAVTALPADAVGTADADEKNSAAPESKKGDDSPRDTDGDGVLDRPDRVSAMSTAIAEKKRVEDLSQRTPTTTSYAKPDGSWTTDIYTAPVRVETSDGIWEKPNSELQVDGETLSPKVSAFGLQLSNGGDKTFARLNAPDGQKLSLGWAGKLPRPTIKGNVATYADALDGGDLVVTATAEGVSHDVVLRQAPAVEEPLEVRVPLGLDGAKASVSDDGSIEVKKGGDLVASAPVPVMFDSASYDGRDDVDREVKGIDATVEGSGKDSVLVLRPDMEFLTDPKTVYPVTLDPSFVITPAADTWVQSTGDTTSQIASPELRVGSNDSGATKARTFIYFDLGMLSSLPSFTTESATLALSNFETGACTGTATEVSRVTGGWFTNTVTWDTQPAVTSTGSATSSGSYGASGCATEADVTFDVKTIFDAWRGGATNLGVRVAASNETAASGWRKFRANDSGMATKIPHLTFTYNTPPAVPTNSAVEPAVADGSNWVTPQSKPTFTSSVSDPDGGQLTPTLRIKQGSAVVEETTLSSVTSGAMASKKPATDLADGTYTAEWKVSDGTATSGWSDPITVVVDTTAPAAPTISCPSTTNLAWYDTRPATTTTCTVTVASGTGAVSATLNGEDAVFPALSSGTTSKSFDLPTSGMFDLIVTARDKAGNGADKSHTFGIGNGAMTSPGPNARSTEVFAIAATSKGSATSGVLQWRLAGTTTWNAASQVKQGLVPWLGTVTTSGTMSTTGNLLWAAGKESGIANPSAIEARVCFNYSGTPSQRCTSLNQLSLVNHAFGGAFPTSTVGPVDVSLLSGEYQLDESDVEIPSYTGGLSLSRSYQSYGEQPATPAQGVFGSGWIAYLDGPDDGAAGYQIVDKTGTNGTISLVDYDGETSIYKFKTGGTTAQAVGVYAAQGEAATFNEKLEIKAGTPKTLELTEFDGTITTWNYAGSGKWTVKNVLEAATTAPATTYSYSGDYVTGIYSAPPGVTCNATTQAQGCRALLFTYTTVAGQQRLATVSSRLWDPKPTSTGAPGSGAAMETKTVMQYDYDTSGRLIAAWDPRKTVTAGQPLKTEYTYQTIAAKTYLRTITPPGEKTWTFNVDGSGRLSTVTRPQDASVGGSDATWAVQYSVPLSGAGLPNLTSSAVDQWAQLTKPTDAAAVFGPEAPGTSDMTYADIAYFTEEGLTTNNASYGAGAWQFDVTNYDSSGNVTSTLNPSNRAAAAAAGSDGPSTARMLRSTTTYNSDGSRVETEVGPTRAVMLENGALVPGRTRVDYVYDDEASGASVPTPGRPAPSANPDDPKPNIVVEERHSVADLSGVGTVYDTKKIRYRYDKVVASDGDGWVLREATRTSTSFGSGWSTTITRHDVDGKLIETRTPQGVASVDGAGSDARSTVEHYYTADSSSPVSVCRNKPEWAGSPCQTRKAGLTSTTPVKTFAGYDYLLNETRVEEVSNTMDRAAVTTYDDAGRKTKETLAMTSMVAADKPVEDTTYAYSPTTGALTTTTSGTATVATTYDSWGRERTQTDGAGNTASTTYDPAGRTATFNDGKGTYAYTYDGNDALGRAERRGMVTKLDTGLASGPDELASAYDADGKQQRLVYPNGLIADTTYDAAGDEYTLAYKKDGTQFAAFSRVLDRDSKVRREYSALSIRGFAYDDRDRLTSVADGGYGGCITRTYTFSLDSNRTSLATSGPGSSGECSTASPTTQNYAYAGNDLANDSGYSYDHFGRTRNVPAGQTDHPTGNLATLWYYSNDMVARIAQQQPNGGPLADKQYSMDALQRIGKISDSTGGVELRKATNHYSDSSDAPAWTALDTRPNSSTGWTSSWTRNVRGPDGELGIIQSSDGSSKIQLTNLHGDIVSTMDNSTGVTALANYAESTEYGLPRVWSSPWTQNYGWLGGKRRSTDTVGGFVLMGARLYNPSSGRFLSMDSVQGGNDNEYVYPADPINEFDLAGRAKTKWIWKKDIKLTAKKTKKLIKALKAGGKTQKIANVLAKFIPQARTVATALKLARIGGKALAAQLNAMLAIGRNGVFIRVGMKKFKGWKLGWVPPWPAYKIAPRFKTGGHRGWL